MRQKQPPNLANPDDFVESYWRHLRNEDEETEIVAGTVWVWFPDLCETIACWQGATDDSKRVAMMKLNSVHSKAVEHLMVLASKQGVDGSPLSHAGRVCRQLMKNPAGFGLDWYHHESAIFDTWPDCLGDMLYKLPQSMQDAIRDGQAAFDRLCLAVDLPRSRTSPGTDSHADNEKLMTILAACGEENSLRIITIAKDYKRSVDERQRLLAEIDRRFVGYKSKQWAELLDCTDGMARSTKWWTEDRQKLARDS